MKPFAVCGRTRSGVVIPATRRCETVEEARDACLRLEKERQKRNLPCNYVLVVAQCKAGKWKPLDEAPAEGLDEDDIAAIRAEEERFAAGKGRR